MKKLLLIPILFIFLLGCAGMQKKPVDYTGLFEKSATATKMYGRDALLGGTKACDNISAPIDGTICQVIDSSNYYWLYIFDTSSSQSEEDPWYANPDDATSGDWVLIYNPGNGHKSQGNANETQTQLSVKDWYQNKLWDNIGQYAGEADWQLPDYDFYVTRIITISVAQNVEICPETNGYIRLDGVLLDQNDCVDSDATLGSKIAVTRAYDNVNTRLEWQLTTVEGVWTDTGPSD